MSFQVHISGWVGGSPEEWRSVLSADDRQLPELSEEQRQLIKKFGWNEADYRRSMLLGQDAMKKAQARGHLLGEAAEKIAAALGPEYKVLAVIRKSDLAAWVLRIQTPIAIRNINVPWELADDLIDAGTETEFERLKNLILFGVGRTELILKR